MKFKTFLGLAVVTAIVMGGAYYASQQRDEVIAETHRSETLYPGLLDRLNDVTEVRVHTSADGPITVVQKEAGRKQGGWVMNERYGYPVDFEKIRQTLIQLAALETIEPKTRKPENFSYLNVRDSAEETSKSIRVTVKAGAETLADIFVGLTRPAETGGVFVRKADENQVWLATGSYQPKQKHLQWLDRNIMNIDSQRIDRVEMDHPDGAFVLSRAEISDENIALETPPPEGKQAKVPNEMNAVAGVGDFMIFEEVRPVSEVDFGEKSIRSTYRTFDGLTLEVVAEHPGEDAWVKVSVRASERDPRVDAYVAEHKEKENADGRLAKEFETPEEIAKSIERINAWTAPWAYRLTGYKTGKVTQSLADMVEDKKPETLPAPANTDG